MTQRETATKAHHTAAEHHDKGNRATAHAHSTKTQEESTTAHTHCTAAHGKSAEATKQ